MVDRQNDRPLWGVLTMFRPRVAFGLAGTQPAAENRLRLFNIGTDGSYTQNVGGQGDLVSTRGQCTPILFLNGATVPGVCVNSLGNTRLRPERSSELEGGFDVTLWNGRFTTTYTRYDKVRNDAIVSVPVAPSIFGGQFNVAENIGEVRNTGTELTLNATVLENRALSWAIGANLSNDNNVLVHLNPGQSSNYALGLVPGYPLFGAWIAPIRTFADVNHDGIIGPKEFVIGDSLVFQGQPNPKYELSLTTDLHLLSGRLGIHATFHYQDGLTQNNVGALNSGSFLLVGNNPTTPLSYQAAVVAATCITDKGGIGCGKLTRYGFIQTVNTFRFNDLSLNYELPRLIASWFRAPRMTMALQGSNLALRTNYRGKDPNVNAFSTVSAVDQTADVGQIPEPKTWWLKLTLGN